MKDFDERERIAHRLLPEFYEGFSSSLEEREMEYERFCVAWDIPMIGDDFSLSHEFLSDNLAEPTAISKNAVQLLFIDHALLYQAEARELLGLPASEEDFYRELRLMLDRLLIYDQALSQHPAGKLTEYPQNPDDQRILAIGALTKWALRRLQCKFPYDSEYYPQDLDVQGVYGSVSATVSPIIPFIVRSQCQKIEPMVTPDQPDRVLAVLTQLVSTEHDLSLYNRRKVLNVQVAQDEVLKLEHIDIRDILKLHELVLDGIQDRTGRIRSGVILAGSDSRKRQPPVAEDVPGRLEAFVRSVNGLSPTGVQQEDYEIVARLAAEFQLIHPFQDGNGRVGHILTNFMLRRVGLPICVVPMEVNNRYIKAMDKAVGDESFSDLVTIFEEYAQG